MTRPMGTDRYLRDLAERVAWTFVQAFLGTLIAAGWFDVDKISDSGTAQAAAVAGIAAVISLIKGVAAKYVGQPDSASTAPGV